MCGIAGIIDLDGFDPAKLVAMTQMIAYRGPSGFGFAYSSLQPGGNLQIVHGSEQPPSLRGPQVGLGNRRLAILDLSPNGNQPMEIELGSFCITYNGEIYNYREIREELTDLGHTFVSGTDTEVILRSYQQWGEQCLQRFNGMWSFAILDRRRQRLFCARDRFGVKPFYYWCGERSFYFGSEIKQILAASGIKRAANLRVIADFLAIGLQDHLEETSFQGVRQLLGGHSLSIDLNLGMRPSIRRYWELETQPELEVSAAKAAEEFQSQFERAVQLRLRSDVPVGVSLSGGLDSSAILCTARRVSPKTEFASFSACFEDSAIDERTYISAVLAATGAVKRWTYPNAEAFWKVADTIAYHQDEPVGGASAFAQWSVMKEAHRNQIAVLLGGQGGDEALCGYRKYYFFHVWHLFRQFNPAALREAVALVRNSDNFRWTYASVHRYLPGFARNRISSFERLAAPELKEASRTPVSVLGAGPSLAERQKSDLLHSSLPTLLRHEDRNSMAHSVESRLPFLDYKLVEFAVRCPPSFKLRDGWTKWILRVALDGTLPENVRLRKSKLGFDTPESDWLQAGLRNGHGSFWQMPDFRLKNCLSEMNVARECRRFLDGEAGALPSEILFRALSLEMWARVHDVS